MTWTIPNETPYTIKRRQSGIKVWSLQKVLDDFGIPLQTDGQFGRRTEAAVATFQANENLLIDGIAGPATQLRISLICQSDAATTLPVGLLRGVIEGESGNLIAAVNWSVPPGVDCGLVQRRLPDATTATDAEIERAFDSLYQVKLLAKTTKGRHDAWFGLPHVPTHERAYRLAVLWHNYQTLASKLANGGEESLSAYYFNPQSWVEDIGAVFADGAEVRTPLEWGQYYALGNPDHEEPGHMVRWVTEWN